MLNSVMLLDLSRFIVTMVMLVFGVSTFPFPTKYRKRGAGKQSETAVEAKGPDGTFTRNCSLPLMTRITPQWTWIPIS